MSEEEKAIEVLKYCKDRNFSAFDKIYFDDETNMCVYQAIETLLTAYEKEKAKVERIKDKLAHLKILAKIENKDIDRIKELEILLREE